MWGNIENDKSVNFLLFQLFGFTFQFVYGNNAVKDLDG